MRRHASGIGCGARARGSRPRTREAPGPDREAQCPFHSEPTGLRLAQSPRPRKRGPGEQKSPRWRAERRHAPETARAQQHGRADRRAIPSFFDGRGNGLRPTRGRKEYWRRSVGCLTFESVSVRSELQFLFSSRLVGDGGHCRAIASTSRVMGQRLMRFRTPHPPRHLRGSPPTPTRGERKERRPRRLTP
jgi:hypothetical protein